MKQYLNITGSLQLPKDPRVLGELVEMAKSGLANWFTMEGSQEEGLRLVAVQDALTPGEEHQMLDFLWELGQRFGGKISGELEVWWPMAVDSGPQWWNLEPDGVLYITESDIVRGPKLPYKEKDR